MAKKKQDPKKGSMGVASKAELKNRAKNRTDVQGAPIKDFGSRNKGGK